MMRRLMVWALALATFMVAGLANGQPAAPAQAGAVETGPAAAQAAPAAEKGAVPFFVATLTGWDELNGRKAVATAGKRLSVVFAAELDCSSFAANIFSSPQGLEKMSLLGCRPIVGEPHLNGVVTFGVQWTPKAGNFPGLKFRYGKFRAEWDLTVLPAPPPAAAIATHQEVAIAKDDVRKDVDKKLDDYGRKLRGWAPLSQRAQVLITPLVGFNDTHATNVPVGIGADILVRLHRFVQLGASVKYVHTPVWTFDEGNPVNQDSVEEKFSFTMGPYGSWAPLEWLELNVGVELGLEVVSYPDTYLSQSSTGKVEFANQATNYVFVVEPCVNVMFHPAPNLSLGAGICGVVNATPYNRTPGYDGQESSWGIVPLFKPIMVGLRM